MLRCWTFSCTSTHRSCYAAGCSLALPRIRHYTLLNVLLRSHTYVYVMLRCWTFSCTSTHTSCYAGRSLALPHMRHATLLDVLLHFHTSLLDVLLHFRHIRHATLLDVLLHLHTYVMLRCWTFSCTSTTSSDNFALEAKKGTFQRSSRDTKLHTVSVWWNTRFSNFEATVPWNFSRKFIGEKQTCANYYSCGHFHHHPVIVWCHQRHGLLQALPPCVCIVLSQLCCAQAGLWKRTAGAVRDAAATAGELGLSISGLLPRSLYKISRRVMLARSLWDVSWQDLRTRST